MVPAIYTMTINELYCSLLAKTSAASPVADTTAIVTISKCRAWYDSVRMV